MTCLLFCIVVIAVFVVTVIVSQEELPGAVFDVPGSDKSSNGHRFPAGRILRLLGQGCVACVGVFDN